MECMFRMFQLDSSIAALPHLAHRHHSSLATKVTSFKSENWLAQTQVLNVLKDPWGLVVFINAL